MIRSRLGALGNFAMFTVILTLIAVAIGFGILFWTGTLWAQGYFYDSPTSGLSWRAPAAAAVLTLFLTIWCTIEYYAPNSTGAIDDFSIEEITSVKKFWSVRPLNAGEEKDKPIAAIENLYDKEKEKPKKEKPAKG